MLLYVVVVQSAHHSGYFFLARFQQCLKEKPQCEMIQSVYRTMTRLSNMVRAEGIEA